MMFSLVILSVALASVRLAEAQSSHNTALGIEAIEAHFTQAQLVPSLLPTFDPIALMTLSYTGVGDIAPGQPLTQDQVHPVPNILVTPANSSVQLGGNYTLVMADAGPVGTDESAGQTRHWLVNGVTLNGTSPLNVSTATGTPITAYAGPAPPSGSGPHRYAILLYTQPENFTAPDGLSAPNTPVSIFNLQNYVKDSGLGNIVAATYITVSSGPANASIPATSSVVTSTLLVPQATSGAGNNSSNASSPGSAGAPVPTGGPNAAGTTIVSLGHVLVAGLVGVFFL